MAVQSEGLARAEEAMAASLVAVREAAALEVVAMAQAAVGAEAEAATGEATVVIQAGVKA